jgi:serine-type D-Ala-D-Ala carboxypeptidase/endopeptidase
MSIWTGIGLRAVTLIVLGGLALNSAAQSVPASEVRMKELLSERIDRYKKSVGMAAFVVDASGVRIAVHGGQSAENKTAISPDTLFEIGSVTKTFTGLLLADMVIKGELKLSDPAEKWLPDGILLRDKAGAPIQLLDLATHRSGLPRLPTKFMPANPADPYVDYREQELLQYLRGRAGDKAALDAAPHRGEKNEYSNLGFGLLGYVLGRAGKSAYADLLQDRVIKPLGLSSTFLVVPDAERARFSDGHNDAGKVVPHWNFDVINAAGALRMSVRDFARYAQAAAGLIETPLAPAFALAMTMQPTTAADANPMGLAWVQAKVGKRALSNHDGGTYGFSSSMWVDRERKQASGVLANAFVSVTDLSLHLIEPSVPLQDLASTEAKAASVDAATLARYVGTYQLTPQMQVFVRAEGRRLFARATGQGEFELFAKSDTEFFARVTPLQIVFFDVKEGKAARFEITQAGSTRNAPRTTPAAEPLTITLDAKQLQAFVGSYRLAPGLDVVIRVRGQRLFSQATGQDEFELFAKSPTVFFARVTELEVEFFDIKDGKAAHFVVTQGGVKSPAPRVE